MDFTAAFIIVWLIAAPVFLLLWILARRNLKIAVEKSNLNSESAAREIEDLKSEISKLKLKYDPIISREDIIRKLILLHNKTKEDIEVLKRSYAEKRIHLTALARCIHEGLILTYFGRPQIHSVWVRRADLLRLFHRGLSGLGGLKDGALVFCGTAASAISEPA